MKVSDNDDDWCEIHSNGELFTGFGDSNKLQLLMNLFKEFIERDLYTSRFVLLKNL